MFNEQKQASISKARLFPRGIQFSVIFSKYKNLFEKVLYIFY